VEREFSGFAARVFLHEHDHLQGMTWLDHVEDNREIVSEQELMRILLD
jgi:peptide deformylase